MRKPSDPAAILPRRWRPAVALLSGLALAAFGSVSLSLLSSVELRLDADRVAATLSGGSAPADRLLKETLRLSVDAEGGTRLVLFAFRIESDRSVSPPAVGTCTTG